jgi:hypothetical protein
MRTLEDALARAEHGPVQRTWGHRLALAWMARTGIPLDWHCKKFWEAMVKPHDKACSPEYARMYRSQDLSGVLDNWYRKLGWERPDCVQRGQWARDYAPAINEAPAAKAAPRL